MCLIIRPRNTCRWERGRSFNFKLQVSSKFTIQTDILLELFVIHGRNIVKSLHTSDKTNHETTNKHSIGLFGWLIYDQTDN